MGYFMFFFRTILLIRNRHNSIRFENGVIKKLIVEIEVIDVIDY